MSRIDPEIAIALDAAAEAVTGIALPARGDAIRLREFINPALEADWGALPPAPDVHATDFETVASDGTVIPLRWYSRGDRKPGAAIVYVHGGGLICGSVDIYDPLVRHYVQLTGVPFLAVDYRLAPEFGGTIPAEDSFAAVRWLLDHADDLEVDTTRVALMGDSGGGGVAAGAAILARDHQVQLARQILIYPMLDDRNTTPDSHLAATATWTYDNNYTGWHALLGDELGRASVSPIAAPARLKNFSGLAPAYIEVGDLDIFRDESMDYARSLVSAGRPCELHLHPGAPHGFEWIGKHTAIGQRSLDEKIRVITSL
ncbi:alpha/beta hydrolase [Rhodococcus globerulus]|uniref:alpha/beta hydrolase n=1 Tax=Rhodococcus globerulus TaxID=33008 RepID=UPI0030163A90